MSNLDIIKYPKRSSRSTKNYSENKEFSSDESDSDEASYIDNESVSGENVYNALGDSDFYDSDNDVCENDKPKSPEVKKIKLDAKVIKKEPENLPKRKAKKMKPSPHEDEDRSHACSFCCLKFNTRKNLWSHTKNLHSKDGHGMEHKSEYCHGKFNTLRQRLVHDCSYHNSRSKNRFKCELCCMTFPTNMSRIKHVKDLHTFDGPRFKSKFCDGVFSSQRRQEFHDTKYHDSCNRRGVFQCDKCCAVLNSKERRDAHLNFHSEDSKLSFKSKYCTGIFKTKNLKDLHDNKYHSSELAEDNNGEIHRGIKCSKCPAVLTDVFHLRLHMNSHPADGEPSQKCYNCQGVFKPGAEFSAHICTGSKANPGLSCLYCNFMTNIPSSLKEHEIIHTGLGTGNFICHECPNDEVKFEKSVKLDNHMIIHHFKKKGFVCKICNLKCNGKKALSQHELVHIKDDKLRPFKCSVDDCEFYFKNKEGRTKHETKAHGIKNWVKCPVPNCNFESTKARMTIHSRAHEDKHFETKDAKFVCEDCGANFKRKCDLTRHTNSFHSIDKE